MPDNTRIYGDKTDIDMDMVHDLYATRAKEKREKHIDQPVVLVADRDPEQADYWTEYEVENILPLFELDESSRVLEAGFGTGRMAKHLIEKAGRYVGIDYVQEFVEIARHREDINSEKQPTFLQGSFQQLVGGEIQLPVRSFDRFFISGGVLMYINDSVIPSCLRKLLSFLDEKSIIYISEPIALNERLTLNQFFSNEMQAEYSAIYRTDAEYQDMFKPLYDAGFECIVNRPFFEEDIKARKETRQWIYILKRENNEVDPISDPAYGEGAHHDF